MKVGVEVRSAVGSAGNGMWSGRSASGREGGREALGDTSAVGSVGRRLEKQECSKDWSKRCTE